MILPRFPIYLCKLYPHLLTKAKTLNFTNPG